MRTIVHIGQHKTGSTALQSVLFADRARLAEHGILYPDVGHAHRRNNRVAPSHNGLFLRLNDQSGRGTRESLDEMATRLADQVTHAQPSVVVISSERGFMLPDQRGVEALDRLDAMLAGPKDVVAYLRRPDRFAASYHRQLIRQSTTAIKPLHDPARLRELTETFQLDYLRTVQLYEDRYGAVTLHDYEQVDDTVSHFYRSVLGIDPPDITPARTNPSLPQVLTNLALDHLHTEGRLGAVQRQSLLAHGEREPVDLLGPENRARLIEWFTPQDVELGRRVGRPRFFANLDAIGDVAADCIGVDDADARYRSVFAALVAPIDVLALRRSALLLEARGHHRSASDLYASVEHHLSRPDRDWYRQDLDAASQGTWTISDGQYARLGDDADGQSPTQADTEQSPTQKPATVEARLRGIAADVRRRAEARLGRR